MSFGGGGGWGGGGAEGREEYPGFRLWGPPGSGAFITPGSEWPFTPEKIVKNKVVWILAIVAILALAGDSK